MADGGAPRVEVKTSLGTFEVELYVKHAPRTCKNFLELSRKGYYNNTVVRPTVQQYYSEEVPERITMVTSEAGVFPCGYTDAQDHKGLHGASRRPHR